MKRICPEFLSDSAFLAYTKSDFVVWLDFNDTDDYSYMIFYVSNTEKPKPYYIGHADQLEDFFINLQNRC